MSSHPKPPVVVAPTRTGKTETTMPAVLLSGDGPVIVTSRKGGRA